MKTEQLTLEYLERMTDPYLFKSFQVKLKEGALPKIKLRRSATYSVQSVQKPSKVFKTYQLHIGRNWYNAEMFRLVTEQDHSVTDETIKEMPIPSGSVKAGDVINVIAKFKAEEIDNKLKQLNDSFELEFKYFEPTKPHPDNATIETLIQYVSDHRDSMSKDSILHFANLIGLIKLGAL